MNMFSKKQNPSGVRRADRFLTKNAPQSMHRGASNDELALSRRSRGGVYDPNEVFSANKSLAHNEEAANVYGDGLS